MKKLASSISLLMTVAITFALSQPKTANTQSLMSIRIGDLGSKLAKLGPAAETGSYLGMRMQKWKLPNGNELSVSLDSKGRIVYIESDWDGNSDDPACDLPGLRFGATTLTQLRKRLESNGFEFQNRSGVVRIEGGIVMLNSYEVGKTIVTFYTKVEQQEHLTSKASDPDASPADYAKLDAISLADPTYAKIAGWGDRIYDHGYKRVKWK